MGEVLTGYRPLWVPLNQTEGRAKKRFGMANISALSPSYSA